MASPSKPSGGVSERLEWAATAVTLAVYFSYILAIAFRPGLLGRAVSMGGVVTWGMVAGAGVIVFSGAIASWYVARANRPPRAS
jgi:uncharacterized membrane protein (DUF485 family)